MSDLPPGKKLLTLRLPEAEYEWWKTSASHRDTSLSDMVRSAVRNLVGPPPVKNDPRQVDLVEVLASKGGEYAKAAIEIELRRMGDSIGRALHVGRKTVRKGVRKPLLWLTATHINALHDLAEEKGINLGEPPAVHAFGTDRDNYWNAIASGVIAGAYNATAENRGES